MIITEIVLAIIASAVLLTPAAATPSVVELQSITTAPANFTVLPDLEDPVSVAEPSYEYQAAIDQAYGEVGTSRETGWGAAGECLVSVQRWVMTGGGAWTGGGTPVTNYSLAEQVELRAAVAGDVIQYELASDPHAWAVGVHTVLITGVNDDGTFRIVESNNPAGSGLVSANDSWTPAPPPGFQVAVWRF